MIEKKIKQLRIKLNLSQEDFGKQLGLKRSNFSAIEAGNKNTLLTILAKIVKNYNIDANYFVNDDIPIEAIDEYSLNNEFIVREPDNDHKHLCNDCQKKEKIINELRKQLKICYETQDIFNNIILKNKLNS